MIKYQNAINKLFHINLDKNDIVIADDTVKVNENLLDDNINSKLRVPNNIETPILNTNEIKATYNCNILTVGDETKIVNIKDNLGINEFTAVLQSFVSNSLENSFSQKFHLRVLF